MLSAPYGLKNMVLFMKKSSFFAGNKSLWFVWWYICHFSNRGI